MKKLILLSLIVISLTPGLRAQTVTNYTACDFIIEGYCYPAGQCSYLPGQPGSGYLGHPGGLYLTPTVTATIPPGGTYIFPPTPCASSPAAMDFAYRVTYAPPYNPNCNPIWSNYWSTDPTCPINTLPITSGEDVWPWGTEQAGSNCSMCTDQSRTVKYTWDASGNMTITN